MQKAWETTTQFLHSNVPALPTSPLHRALLAIGTLSCATQAFNLLSFAQIYLLRGPNALDRFTIIPRKQAHGTCTAWALITGSSDGIGKGFAEELCSRGINVVLHGRNESKLHAVRQQLLAQWPAREIRILILDASADASDEVKLRDAARSLDDIELRILVNNVGGNGSVTPLWAPLSARSSADVGQFIDINARFATEITRVCLPLLTRQARPSLILNVGSAISDYPVPYLGMYSAGKAYLATFSKSLRTEMRAEGLGVEVVHLRVGMVATEREADRVPGWLTPSARGFAKSALDVVGCGRQEVWPWWQHGVQFGLVGGMPRWLRERIFVGLARKERATTTRKR